MKAEVVVSSLSIRSLREAASTLRALRKYAKHTMYEVSSEDDGVHLYDSSREAHRVASQWRAQGANGVEGPTPVGTVLPEEQLKKLSGAIESIDEFINLAQAARRMA